MADLQNWEGRLISRFSTVVVLGGGDYDGK